MGFESLANLSNMILSFLPASEADGLEYTNAASNLMRIIP